MKIKFSLDDELPLTRTIEIPSMIIIARAVFHENNKYYPQVFLDQMFAQIIDVNPDAKARSYDQAKSYDEEIKYNL